tara:strand:- start:69 stop:1433 length:1365 start_codon:yes stop_codon:yes gene_type:complete
MKKIILYIILCHLIIAQSSIKIYNQGWALVKEDRNENLQKSGEQLLFIYDLPLNIDPASINVSSETINFLSKEYIYKPITINNLLYENIGNEIQLVRYNNNENSKSSISAKLISYTDIPIFEIDNKIVIDPPYNYEFPNIPYTLKDNPYIECKINSSTKNANYVLNYLLKGISWGAEFNLYINSDNTSEVQGWYFIKNSNNYSYKMMETSLVSGNINFFNQKQVRLTSPTTRTASSNYQISVDKEPQFYNTEDYYIYKIPEKINLSRHSEFRYKFLEKKEVDYTNIYHVSHQLSRYKRYNTKKTEKIPVNIRLEIDAKNIGNFQLPSGNYYVYEKDGTEITFIGSDKNKIVSEKNKIKLEIGKSHEILSTFTIMGMEIDKNKGEIDLEAKFDNNKNKTIVLKWVQNFSDSNWKIIKSDHNYSKINANQVEFLVTIPSKSNNTINFSAEMWGNRY